MRGDQTEIDGQVLATLRASTLSGVAAVMNPKRISHHIGHFHYRHGVGPNPAGCHGIASPTRGARPRGARGSFPHRLDDHERPSPMSLSYGGRPVVTTARQRAAE